MSERYTTLQVTPYFAEGERYPSLIGVKAEGDEHETAYVKKSDMAKAVDYWRRMCEGDANTRWNDLFGTPERAARTLRGFCEQCRCGDCATCGVPEWADYSHGYDALLEWLRGDA